MKNKLTLFFLLLSISSYTQSLQCSDFKTGEFRMDDPKTGVNYITRDSTSQIEYLPQLEIKLKLKVKWLDDCRLELSFDEMLENPNNLPEYDIIIVSEIIEIRGNSYVMKSTMEGSDFVLTREYFKVE